MSEDTDIAILGENIVSKCGELIPDAWLPKVSYWRPAPQLDIAAAFHACATITINVV